MKKNLFLAAFTLGAASLGSTLLSAPVRAIETVNVPIKVDVPEVIYIQTYKSLTFKPNASEFLGSAALPNDTIADFYSNGSVSKTLPPVSGTLTPNTGTITTGDVLVYKIWGTSTGTSNQIHHTVEYNSGTSGTLYLNGDIAAAETVDITISSSPIDQPAPGLNTNADPIEGKVAFTFNFANGKKAGTYSNPTQFLTITATGI